MESRAKAKGEGRGQRLGMMCLKAAAVYGHTGEADLLLEAARLTAAYQLDLSGG